MATRKIRDAAVKVGTYQSNGETKNRYLNIGALMEGDNGMFLMLNRTFNPAGVEVEPGRDSIIVSLFEPRQADGSAPAPAAARPSAPPDDDIPF